MACYDETDVAAQAEQSSGAHENLSPLQRMTQAAARRPAVAEVKSGAAAPVERTPKPSREKGLEVGVVINHQPEVPKGVPVLVDGGVARAQPTREPSAMAADLPDAVPAQADAEHFDCALSVKGVLRMEQGAQRMDITVDNARKLLRYLDRIRPEEGAAA